VTSLFLKNDVWKGLISHSFILDIAVATSFVPNLQNCPTPSSIVALTFKNRLQDHNSDLRRLHGNDSVQCTFYRKLVRSS